MSSARRSGETSVPGAGEGEEPPDHSRDSGREKAAARRDAWRLSCVMDGWMRKEGEGKSGGEARGRERRFDFFSFFFCHGGEVDS